MTTTVIEKKLYTYTDYAALQDGKYYELINGELTMTPAPALLHQRISRDMEYTLWHYIHEHGLGELLDAPVDVILSEKTVVQPDLIFVAKERTDILKPHAIVGAPDMVVEIVSPSSSLRDRYTKRELYASFGVREYWIIDPANQTIEVLTLKEGTYELSSPAEEETKVVSGVIAGFTMETTDLFPAEQNS